MSLLVALENYYPRDKLASCPESQLLSKTTLEDLAGLECSTPWSVLGLPLGVKTALEKEVKAQRKTSAVVFEFQPESLDTVRTQCLLFNSKNKASLQILSFQTSELVTTGKFLPVKETVNKFKSPPTFGCLLTLLWLFSQKGLRIPKDLTGTRTLTTVTSEDFKKKYTMTKKLGEGSFGEVWKGKVIATNKVVALKKIKNPSDLVGLRYEQELHEKLTQQAKPGLLEHIENLYDGTDYYVVTEFMGGGTLESLEPAISGKEDVLSYVARCCLTGLKSLAELDYLHRDIKEDNIMCTADGVVKLVDFGLTLASTTHLNTIKQASGMSNSLPAKVDRSKWWDGSMAMDYWSPELWRGGMISQNFLKGQLPAISSKSDVFALGITLLKLYKKSTYTSDNIGKMGIIPGEDATMELVPSTLGSAELVDFFKKMLDVNPVSRQDAATLLSHAFITGHSSYNATNFKALLPKKIVFVPSSTKPTSVKSLKEILSSKKKSKKGPSSLRNLTAVNLDEKLSSLVLWSTYKSNPCTLNATYNIESETSMHIYCAAAAFAGVAFKWWANYIARADKKESNKTHCREFGEWLASKYTDDTDANLISVGTQNESMKCSKADVLEILKEVYDTRTDYWDSPSKRANYLATVDNTTGRLTRASATLANAAGEMFVARVSDSGDFELGVTKKKSSTPRHHHSSFFAGANCFASGYIWTDADGNVTQITSGSGHYLKDMETMQKEITVMVEVLKAHAGGNWVSGSLCKSRNEMGEVVAWKRGVAESGLGGGETFIATRGGSEGQEAALAYLKELDSSKCQGLKQRKDRLLKKKPAKAAALVQAKLKELEKYRSGIKNKDPLALTEKTLYNKIKAFPGSSTTEDIVDTWESYLRLICTLF